MCQNLKKHGYYMSQLWISQTVVDFLTAQLGTQQSREHVGVLIGSEGLAFSAIRLNNSTDGPSIFRLEQSELLRAARYAEQQSYQIVALYHSHPSGDLRLSKGDEWPLMRSAWPWVIITLDDNRLQISGYCAKTCEPLRVTFEYGIE